MSDPVIIKFRGHDVIVDVIGYYKGQSATQWEPEEYEEVEFSIATACPLLNELLLEDYYEEVEDILLDHIHKQIQHNKKTPQKESSKEQNKINLRQ